MVTREKTLLSLRVAGTVAVGGRAGCPRLGMPSLANLLDDLEMGLTFGGSFAPCLP